MKVTATGSLARALSGSALLIALAATLTLALPLDAGAAARAKTTTREDIIERAQSWVKQRVPYSQSSYHAGYRQDCSGFVSMAWSLDRSYSTSTLPSVSTRVSRDDAKPGDAVLRPGHVVVFAEWKNEKAGTFYAYEQRTWGKVATRSVQRMRTNSTVLRRPDLRDPKPTLDNGELPVNRAAATWSTDASVAVSDPTQEPAALPPVKPTVDLERTAPPVRQPS